MTIEPAPPKRLVVLGFLGTKLDTATLHKRWDRWRPTVDLCRHEDMLVQRLELLRPARFSALAGVVGDDIRQISPETEVVDRVLEVGDPWDFEEVFAALHDFARSYPFDQEAEQYLVHITTGTHVQQICLFLLTESRHIPARLLQTSPPRPSSRGTPGTYSLIDLDLSRYDRIASRFAEEREEGLSFLKSGIDTRNARFNRLISRIEQVAIRSQAPILLTGPTGAGKSRLARRIFALKQVRRQVRGAFVEVNCATLRGDAAMSALFGHTRGAYTGALRDRPGLLRSADSGVLFLDEIGELGVDEQAMLLRALEEKTFLPVGSDKEVSSDFQLIAGTNRDLATAVRTGRFREDLLARINLWTFQLPGLRDRPEDIEPNLEYELAEWTRSTGQRVTMNTEARAAFLRFGTAGTTPWRGNFRDFNAAMVRMATLAPGGRITRVEVDEEIARLRTGWGLTEPGDSDGDGLPSLLGAERVAELDRFDRVQLTDVVAVCRRARTLSEAGRALFSESRKKKARPNDADRLRKYLARFGLSWATITGVDA